jgi:hypothetical protein
MYSSTHSLTSALDRGEWLASRPDRFTPRERAPCTHWIGGWVGPRAVLDAVVKRKIPSPRWESNRRIPIVQPVVQLYTDWAITVLLDGGVWSNSCPRPRGKETTIPLYGRLGGPQDRFGRGDEEKNPCLCLESNAGRPAPSIVTKCNSGYNAATHELFGPHDFMNTFIGK